MVATYDWVFEMKPSRKINMDDKMTVYFKDISSILCVHKSTVRDVRLYVQSRKQDCLSLNDELMATVTDDMAAFDMTKASGSNEIKLHVVRCLMILSAREVLFDDTIMHRTGWHDHGLASDGLSDDYVTASSGSEEDDDEEFIKDDRTRESLFKICGRVSDMRGSIVRRRDQLAQELIDEEEKDKAAEEARKKTRQARNRRANERRRAKDQQKRVPIENDAEEPMHDVPPPICELRKPPKAPECIVCFEKKLDMALMLPCRHCNMCTSCAREWTRKHSWCPTCRVEASCVGEVRL